MDKFVRQADSTSSSTKKNESETPIDISSMSIKKKTKPGMQPSFQPPPPPAPPPFQRPTSMPAGKEMISDHGKSKGNSSSIPASAGFRKGFLDPSGSSASSSETKGKSQQESSPKHAGVHGSGGGFKKGFFGSSSSSKGTSSSSSSSTTHRQMDDDPHNKEFKYTTSEKEDGTKVDKLKNDDGSGEWTINRLPNGKFEASFKSSSGEPNTKVKSNKAPSTTATSSSSSSSSSVKNESSDKNENTKRKYVSKEEEIRRRQDAESKKPSVGEPNTKDRSHNAPSTTATSSSSSSSSVKNESSDKNDSTKRKYVSKEEEIRRMQEELKEAYLKRDEYLEKRKEFMKEDAKLYMERYKNFNYLKGKVYEPAWEHPDRFPETLYKRYPTRPFPDLWVDGGPMSTKNFLGEDRTGLNFFVDPNEKLYLEEARRDCHDWNPNSMNMTTMMIRIEKLGQEQGIKELQEVLELNEQDRDKEGFDEEVRVRELLIKWIEKTKKEFPRAPIGSNTGGPEIGEGFLKPKLESDVDFKEMTNGAVMAAIQQAERDKSLYCKEAEETFPDGDKFVWRKYGKKLFEERRKWEDAKRADNSLPSEGAYNLATRLIWACFDYTKPFDLEPPKKETFHVDSDDGLYKIDPSIDKKSLPKALRDLL